MKISEEDFEEYVGDILTEQKTDLKLKIEDNIYEGLFERDITKEFFEFLHGERFNVNSGLIIYIVGKKGGGKTHKALSISHHLMSDKTYLAIYQGNPELTNSIQKTKIYREDQVYHTSTTSQIKPRSTVNIDEGQLSLNAKNAQKKDSKEIEEALATLRHNNSHIIVNSQRWKGSLAAVREQADIFIFCRLNYLTIKAIDDDEIRDILIKPENRLKARSLKFSAIVISNYEKWQNSGIVHFKLEDCPFWNNEISKNYENMSILQALNYQKEVEVLENKLASEFIYAYPEFTGKNLSHMVHYYILTHWKNPKSVCHNRLTDFSDPRFIHDVHSIIVGKRFESENGCRHNSNDSNDNEDSEDSNNSDESIVDIETSQIKKDGKDLSLLRKFDLLTKEFAEFCRSYEQSSIKGIIIEQMVLGAKIDEICQLTHQTQRYVTDLLYVFRTDKKSRNGRHIDISTTWRFSDMLEQFIAKKTGGQALGFTYKDRTDVCGPKSNYSCKAIYSTRNSVGYSPKVDCSPEMKDILTKPAWLVVFNSLWKYKFYVYKLSVDRNYVTVHKNEITELNLLLEEFVSDHIDGFQQLNSDCKKSDKNQLEA